MTTTTTTTTTIIIIGLLESFGSRAQETGRKTLLVSILYLVFIFMDFDS